MNMSHKAVCLKALHLTVCKLYLHKNEGNNNNNKDQNRYIATVIKSITVKQEK